MCGDNEIIFSEEEKSILQEIMNIAFGKASADLAELIDIYVVLSVPFIQIIKATDLPEYLKSEIKEYENVSVVEQKYWGKFKGDALLVFPAGAGKDLITLLDPGRGDLTYESDPIDVLESESLMEIANILFGACVGKIAELLKDSVTYSPPRVILEESPFDSISQDKLCADSSVILLKTVFQFKERNVNGFLFLTTSHDSIDWLKKALHDFMEQYE